jgi:Na+-driven multidrug efflux pump
MGVAGVAWATFICQGVSCVLAVLFVLKRLAGMHSEKKAAVFSWKLLGQIAVIAIPSILQQSFISVGNIILQSVINGFGPSVMAGYSAAIKLNNLVITSLTTLSNGISNYTSQNFGANQLYRIRQGFKAGWKIVWLICIPLVLLYQLAGRYLVYIFMQDITGEAIDTGVTFLRIVSPFYFVVSIKLVADGITRGAGRMGAFMIATFTDLILRVVLSLIFSVPFQATGIWCSWPVGWTIGMMISVFFYLRGPWRNAQPENTQETLEVLVSGNAD